MNESPLKELWQEIPAWFKIMFVLMLVILFMTLVLSEPKPREPIEDIDFPCSEMLVFTHQGPKPIYVDILLRKKVWVF